MQYLKVILTVVFAACILVAQAQVDSMYGVITDRLKAFRTGANPTRLFLHADKSVYLHNENIWFAAYVLSSPYDIKVHHTLYVCLTDPANKKTVTCNKFVMNAGLGAGYVFLPDSIPAGDYQLIAFTNTYPLEQSPPVFVQSIKFHAPASFSSAPPPGTAVKSNAAADSARSVKINWYPESGNMVARIRTKVAFEAHALTGKPLGFTGDLLEDDKPIMTVQSNETGTGRFEFTPAVGKKYSIKPRTSQVSVISEKLPPIMPSGYNITVPQSIVGDSLIFYVSGRPRINKVYVMVHDFKRDSYFEEVSTLGNRFGVSISSDKLPAGLNTITVFDSTGRPVAERSVFNGSAEVLNIRITPDSAAYHTRSKVKLSIRTVDASGKAAPAVFSLAAVFQKRIDTLGLQDIASAYYFEHYIKQGSIHSVGNASQAEMELFLLTKGWTRYRWDEPPPVAMPPPIAEPLTIKGMVLFKGRTIPKPVEVIIMNKAAVYTVMSDENGLFELSPEITATVPDWKLALTVNTKNKEGYSFRMFEPEDSIVTSLAGKFASRRRIAGGEILPEELPEFSGAKKLDTVVVKAAKKHKFDEDYSVVDGKKVFRSISCADYVCQNNILNCSIHRSGGTAPQDGETYYAREQYGRNLVPVVYRPCPALEKKETASTLMLHKIKGRYYSKEFYVNDFSSATAQDVSSTLMWLPLQKSDANGMAEISFYTNDLEGSFICILQGMAPGGAITGRAIFKVKK